MRHVYLVWNFLIENSFLLVVGAMGALLWANTQPESYHALQEWVLFGHSPIGHVHVEAGGEATRTLTLHYLVNDVLMALFFAMAFKEVCEALFLRTHDRNGNEREKGGKLRGKKAFTPVIATLGGMAGPALIYLCIASLFGSTTYDALQNGWAVPTATDIAFSYFFGRLVFGAKHPAVSFLLLLAVVDDALGLAVLAVFYNSGDIRLEWLLLAAATAAATGAFFNWGPRLLDAWLGSRIFVLMRKRLSVLPYVAAGVVSWYAFQESGIHPALGLLPVVLVIPQADQDHGIFAEEEGRATDLLNVMEHAIKLPVQFVLFAFAFLNAGIVIGPVGEATWAVLGGLLIGKPIGIFLFGWFAAYMLRLGLPKGMGFPDLWVLGCLAGTGFTVALFVSVVAFDAGSIQDGAKMGALLSISAFLIAGFFGLIYKVRRRRPVIGTYGDEAKEEAVAA